MCGRWIAKSKACTAITFACVLSAISADSTHVYKNVFANQKRLPPIIRLTLNIAANYGGRWDIVQGVRQLAEQVQAGVLRPDQIDEERLGQQICMHELAPVDLVIRTGGEHRISNFLLWQIAYAELYFTDVLWPDFDEQDFEGALHAFANRERRFGGTEPGDDKA
nr:polyprenyl diphosphate synthase [Salmonella enterica]